LGEDSFVDRVSIASEHVSSLRGTWESHARFAGDRPALGVAEGDADGDDHGATERDLYQADAQGDGEEALADE
jgi:hypothetical protein